VGTWRYANKKALRIGAAVPASLAMVFWSQPTGKVVLLLAGLLLVALALIELLGRPPERPTHTADWVVE
jgi:chromate transport protein ChrA